jgi:outer membrane protein assembly factor BamB
MKKQSVPIFISAIMLLIFFSGSILAQDWPQFRGSTLNNKVTGFKAPKAWPQELKQEWKVTVGTGDASPALAGRKIYLHTRQEGNEVILCLDAATGKELWKDSYPANPVTGAAASHPGPRSTPSVVNGKVVTFGVTGILSCLDANTGKVMWRKENPTNAYPVFFTGMSPLIVDGNCIAHVGIKDNGTVLCLDLNSGNEKWKWSGDGPAYASPSVMTIGGKKHIIIQTEKNLMAFDLSDGKVLWQIASPPLQRFYNCASPFVDGQTIYQTGQGAGTKAYKIEVQGDKFVPKELWTNPTTGAKWNTPVLRDGFLYGFTDTKKIYCINAADGKLAWLDETVHSDFATLVDCGEVLIGLSQTGNLVVFKPVSNAYSEVAKYKVSETPVYAYPVISGNSIYVKDAESLILYKF